MAAARKSHRSRAILPLAVVAAVVILGVCLFYLIRYVINAVPVQQKKVAQEIHVIRPPPPPPDVPPPPPPPPEEKVDVNDPEPQPDPTPSNDPPPSEQLGLDAEGGVGGDAFGLMGHKGGRDLLATGGSALAWYAGLIKTEIVDQLSSESEARGAQYSVTVKVWVQPDGTVERVRLVESTGNRDRDRAIEAALARIRRISQAPPAGMPQPTTLRIVSRV
jgi:periplasmic protein TonB